MIFQHFESDAIRAMLLDRVRAMELAERDRPAVSLDREGALVEMWL